MILEQLYLGCLAHASYFIADEKTKTAIVVDPRRDIAPYLDRAREIGAKIEHVFLTHFHADYLAGHLELRERCGATIHLGAKAEAEYAFESEADGSELTMGNVRLRVLETPGHTPESISILVFDLEKSSDAPQAVLTGDTLFIGDVGRPDLMASIGVTAEELAADLYDSTRRLLELPDETIVYPGHGAGSMCGKNLSSATFSTLGEQRQLNYALQPMTKAEFVAEVTANQPDAPAYFAYDAVLNRSERSTLDEVLENSLAPLSIEELLRRRNSGAQLLDVRPETDYAAGHLRDSINIPLDGKFATWAGTLLASDREILLIGVAGMEQEAAVRLGRIGFDRMGGYLEDLPAALAGAPELVRTHERIDPGELRAKIAGGDPPLVVDVRAPGEFEAGHIEGAVHVPLNHLRERLDEIPRDRDVALICLTGYRSSTAASILLESGYPSVCDLDGGMTAWLDESEQASACGA